MKSYNKILGLLPKKEIQTAILCTLFIYSGINAEAKSPKRGVSENQFSVGCQLEALEPGVSWYYNWGTTPGVGYKNQVIDFEGIEYVPMCWNGNYNAQAIRHYCATHPQTKYLLGFNEPNFKAQANMTPAEAAEKWPGVQALAKELGLKLVAPALNYSPDAPYSDPLKWMDEFVAIVGEDAFDYTAVHSYGGFGVLKGISENFHNRYNKPVWVTEFCYWPGEQSGVSVTPDTQINSMVESLEWLEKTEWIFRYAWFKPIGDSTATSGKPNYGLLQPQQGLVESHLSQQGNVYVYLPEFCENFCHPTEQWISAVHFNGRNVASISSSSDPEAPLPLEISSFVSGAYIDYSFNVPTAGDYNLALRVSGFGEPTRFDPQISIFRLTNSDEDPELLATPEAFRLPNDDDLYEQRNFTITLPQGAQTIRIKDQRPYQPSGLRLSAIALQNAAGIPQTSGVSEPVNVYTASGIILRENVEPTTATAGLNPGFYIIGKQKIIIK